MTPGEHLAVIELEGSRLASMPPEMLGAEVPFLDGWTVERVIRHTGKIHQWVLAMLACEPGADPSATGANLAGIPKGEACLSAYREALDTMVAALREHDPEDKVATFNGEGSAGFWYRRQAHEVAVHRLDAARAVEAAGGTPAVPIDPEVAADGVDEWAHVFLANRWLAKGNQIPDSLRGRTVHIHGTDDPPVSGPSEWLFTFGEGSVTVEAVHAKGDVALRGHAADLLSVVWRRADLDTLGIVGDRAVAEAMYDAIRI